MRFKKISVLPPSPRESIKRREFIKTTGILSLGLLGAGRALAESLCSATPAQMEGPFYPVTHRDDVNYDLTRVDGQAGQALGEMIVVRGVVRNAECELVTGALVEIWQASANGRYDHPDDDNSAPIDPNFQYWGRVTTGLDGRYSFRTILPGLYPGRTRHIHFKVVAPGYRSLTTQLYFDGEARNATDEIYRSLSAAQRRLVTTSLAATSNPQERLGQFDIVIGRRAGGVRPSLIETPELD